MGLEISQNWNMPMWQAQNFNNFTTPFAFNYGDIWNNFSTSSGNTSNKEMTFEEHLKRREEEQKAAAQKANEQQAIVDLNKLKQDKIKELDISKKLEATKQTKAQVEKAKKSDGSSSVRTPYKKLGFWGKVGRWCSNAGSAVVNIGKNLVGIEKDGSWNWKKCLKNVGITALAVGACCIPYVGPFIGYTLAATGVAMGTYGAVKGIYNLNKASDSDDEAIDNAQQEIITGLFTGITSAFGLRAIGKGVSSSSASVAAERTSVAGKALQSTSQFGRDVTVNAWRATAEAMKADRALIRGQSGKWGITKFFQASGKKMGSAYESTFNKETIYKNKYSEAESSINNRLSEVTNKLATETNPAKKALLQEEEAMLKLNLKELQSLGSRIKTKADYDKLLQENAGTFNKEYASLLDNTVNGASIAPRRLEIFNRRVQKFQEAYSKKLAELVKAKNKEMYKKAGNVDKYRSELNQYVPTRNVDKNLLKPSTWRQNEYQLAIGKTKGSGYGSFLKLTTTHPASTAPKAMQIFDPVYTIPIGYGQEIASDQYDETIRNLDLQTTQLEQEEKAINDCKDVNELNAIDAQLNQSAQTETTGSENEQKTQSESK